MSITESQMKLVAQVSATHGHELASADYYLIKVPIVPFPGGLSQADFYRNAASRLEIGDVGGRNLTEAVQRLLSNVAVALEVQS